MTAKKKRAEIYSFVAAATMRRKVTWRPTSKPNEIPIEPGDTWVRGADREECTVEGLTFRSNGKIQQVHYRLKSDGELLGSTETKFRKEWCEKQQFLSQMNQALCRAVVLRPVLNPPTLEKGWEVWRENGTGELFIVTGKKTKRGRVFYLLFKGKTNGEISEEALHELYTWVVTI